MREGICGLGRCRLRRRRTLRPTSETKSFESGKCGPSTDSENVMLVATDVHVLCFDLLQLCCLASRFSACVNACDLEAINSWPTCCVDNLTGRWRRNAWPAHKAPTKSFCGPSSTQRIKCRHSSGPSHYLFLYLTASTCPALCLPTSARASVTTSAISPAFGRQQVGNLAKILKSYFPLSLALRKKPCDAMGLRHLLSRIDTGRLPSSPRTPSSPH